MSLALHPGYASYASARDGVIIHVLNGCRPDRDRAAHSICGIGVSGNVALAVAKSPDRIQGLVPAPLFSYPLSRLSRGGGGRLCLYLYLCVRRWRLNMPLLHSRELAPD